MIRQAVPRRLEPKMETNHADRGPGIQWYEKVWFTPESKFIILFDIVRLFLIYLYFIEIPITIAFGKEPLTQKTTAKSRTANAYSKR